MRYPKAALRFTDQLALLRQRGLDVPDPARALHWLANVSYYHLSAYFLPFKVGDTFQPGTTFDDIAGLYIFDRKLRLLMLDAIERLEVAVRTAVTYEIAHAYGPFGYTDAANFAPRFNHARFMADLAAQERHSKETFVTHFRNTYTFEPHLPVWMATELLTFGTMSTLYGALDSKIKNQIAQPYGVNAVIVENWLHAITYVRNVCAHHRRLWNRQLAIKPKIPNRSTAWLHRVTKNDRLYAILVILQHTLSIVSPRCHWRERLVDLIHANPRVPTVAMGFPVNWETEVTWR